MANEAFGYHDPDAAIETELLYQTKTALNGTARIWGSQMVLCPDEYQAHSYFFGKTRQGKSKLMMEGNFYDMVMAGEGVMPNDPAGRSIPHQIRFCAQHRIQKVVLIDRFQYKKQWWYPTLNPLWLFDKTNENAVSTRAGLIADAISTAWADDVQKTPRLVKFLTAILQVLVPSGLTLVEADAFLSGNKADTILSRIKLDSETRSDVKHAADVLSRLLNPTTQHSQADTTLESSENRLQFTYLPNFQYMFGYGGEGMPLTKLVEDGWVILVNLASSQFAQRLLEPRLLGSILINWALTAKPKTPFYMMVDEVGFFATAKLVEILALHQGNNFVLYLANQYLKQLDAVPGFRDAIMSNCSNFAIFQTQNPEDARFFAGQLFDEGNKAGKVDLLRSLEKQYAVIKTNEQGPEHSQIRTIEDPPLDTNLDSFYSQLIDTGWYHTADQVKKAIASRFPRYFPGFGHGSAPLSVNESPAEFPGFNKND